MKHTELKGNIPTLINNVRPHDRPIGIYEKFIEDSFTDELCIFLCDLFDISSDDKRFVIPLIKNNIYYFLTSEDYRNLGILTQYRNSIIKDFTSTIDSELNLFPNKENKSEEKIITTENEANYLNPITRFRRSINEIKRSFVKISDIKDDGTFETIFSKQQKSNELSFASLGCVDLNPCRDMGQDPTCDCDKEN